VPAPVALARDIFIVCCLFAACWCAALALDLGNP
jgi:hypothetical protein